MEFCRKHPTNPHWWEARNTKGVVGFVPAIYMMVGEGINGNGNRNKKLRGRRGIELFIRRSRVVAFCKLCRKEDAFT